MCGRFVVHFVAQKVQLSSAFFGFFFSEVQCCDVKIQCEMRLGEQPLPTKNKYSLEVSLSLIGFFQKINSKSSGQTEKG